MSRSAKITRFFGDADYAFALLIGQLEELQELTDCGLQETLNHLSSIRLKDINAVLRLGLIGGGMEKQQAYRLVVRNVVPGELASCALLAVEVVNAAIAGVPDEPLGEDQGEWSETLSPEEKSSSLPSTEPELSSATRPRRSRKHRSGSSEPQSTDGPEPTGTKLRPPRRRRTSTTKS